MRIDLHWIGPSLCMAEQDVTRVEAELAGRPIWRRIWPSMKGKPGKPPKVDRRHELAGVA